MRRVVRFRVLSTCKTISLVAAIFGLLLSASYPNLAHAATAPVTSPDYLIGPGDALQIFVWHNPDLTASVPVRPDGRVSIPLVEDIPCAGKTPTQLARDIEGLLKKYIQDPTVTVIVSSFVGLSTQQIRIVGQAAQPKAIPYRADMSILDAMISVGGLTTYAAGDRSKLVRMVNGQQTTINVRLQDLLEDGDITANVALQPGDIIIIPESFF
jgi:polysaccharide export outer membrane protein